MANLEIYFVGLICLISTDEDRDMKTHAAAIIASDHEPTLLIGNNDIEKDPEEIPLEPGDRLKIDKPGIAGRDGLFAQLMPPLNNLVNGTLDFRVQTGGAFDKAIYLRLPQGTLHVAENFQHSAFYTLGDKTRGYPCVAYVSWLDTETPSLHITHYGKSKTKYDAKTWIMLRNVEPVGATAGYNHLIHYRHITQGSSATASISTVKDGCKTTTVTYGNYTKKALKHKGRNIDIECVSSQWP